MGTGGDEVNGGEGERVTREASERRRGEGNRSEMKVETGETREDVGRSRQGREAW
jgi:hypothetical protein